MNTEKICISRKDDVIEGHKKRLDQILPKFQILVNHYNELQLKEHSRSLPEIIKNAFIQCRHTVQAGLPPALAQTNAVETILLQGEERFFALLAEMRKAGDLDLIQSFTLTKLGTVEINQESVKAFEEEHSIFLKDLKAKELLERVVSALNDWEDYSEKNYRPGATLVLPAFGGGMQLNSGWHICNRDKNGKLVLNLSLLGLFERGRIK